MIKNFSLIILGAQGSGKGTQAVMLGKKFNLPIFSTGDVLREIIQKPSKLAKIIKKYSESGKLVPLKIIKKILFHELKKSRYQKGVIFDAIPRNLAQTKILTEAVEKFQIPSPILIYLKIKKSTGIKRISQRKICPKCDKIFFPKSQEYQKGICQKCHQKIIQRKDDQPAAVAQRLAIFFRETKKVIDFYQKQNKIIIINGEPKIETVFQEILKHLKSFYEYQNQKGN